MKLSKIHDHLSFLTEETKKSGEGGGGSEIKPKVGFPESQQLIIEYYSTGTPISYRQIHKIDLPCTENLASITL